MPNGRPTLYASGLCESVIDIAKKRPGSSKAKIAVELNIGRATLYRWMGQHPEFRDAIKEAELIAQVWWEDLGVEGMLGKVPRFNATSYIFQMKNRFPHDYRDRREDTVLEEGPVQAEPDWSRLSDDELRQYRDLTAKLVGVDTLYEKRVALS